MNYVNAVWMVLLELAPWLLVGATVAGLLHVILPPNYVRDHLQGKGSVFKAVVLGVPLPLCSCGVIPAGLGLKKDGASDGASMAFLISTPQTGVDSILVSAAFLGWPFALFKVGSAFITGFIGGVLTDRFGGEAVQLHENSTAGDTHNHRGLSGMLAHADELLRSIWGWLAIGVLVSAAISVWLPTEAIAGLTQWGGLVTMGAVLLISLPMYVCATASVPIAAALVGGGLPAGAALVFLMAGPATNVATIGAVYRGFGGRILGIYLSTIVIGSVALGMAFDAVLPTTIINIIHHGQHDAWWAVLSAGFLLVLMGRYAAQDLRNRWSAKQLAQRGMPNAIIIDVEGMTCGGCVSRLQGVLDQAEGVEKAVVTLEPGQATVKGQLDSAAVCALIEGAGFKASA